MRSASVCMCRRQKSRSKKKERLEIGTLLILYSDSLELTSSYTSSGEAAFSSRLLNAASSRSRLMRASA